MERIKRINQFSELRRQMNLLNSLAPRTNNFDRSFELDALELEEQFDIKFPRRHVRDRENPLDMFERPGEFR